MRFQFPHPALLISCFAAILSAGVAVSAAAAEIQPGIKPTMRVVPPVHVQTPSQAWKQEYAATSKTLAEAEQIAHRLDVHQQRLRQLAAQLQGTGDDAQMAQLELQDLMQRQQQVMQTMSNVSKALHDTEMGMVRKMGD